jgi:hypothetical protein
MKTKLFLTTMLAIMVCLSANMLFAQDNNALEGSVNSFEPHYGQVFESPARGAQDALLYIDFELADGKIPEALLNLGYTVTVATDWFDFSTKLNNGDYGLAVAFNQNEYWTTTGAKPTLLSALTNYINNGGSVVFNDWVLDNDFATLFEANFTGNINQTEMNLDPSIEGGVPNPIILANPGWSVFSTGLISMGSSQDLATFANGDVAIVKGNGGKTIILGYLTDTPPEAHRQQLFENLFVSVTVPPAPPVPVSNWALYIGILLMLTFIVIRFRRMI